MPASRLAICYLFQAFAYADTTGYPLNRYFSFSDGNGINDHESDALGIVESFGITVRRKAIGLSIDYLIGKPDTPYNGAEAGESGAGGKEKIKSNSFQAKLSFTL